MAKKKPAAKKKAASPKKTVKSVKKVATKRPVAKKKAAKKKGSGLMRAFVSNSVTVTKGPAGPMPPYLPTSLTVSAQFDFPTGSSSKSMNGQYYNSSHQAIGNQFALTGPGGSNPPQPETWTATTSCPAGAGNGYYVKCTANYMMTDPSASSAPFNLP